MKIKNLQIGDLRIKYPIVQGGMGVGVSLSRLAGNVSLNGGLGVISGVEIGFEEPDFMTNKIEANLRALARHIKEAKRISEGRPIGLNLMVAINNFDEYVKAAVKEKVDIIFSGAGLPLSLPKFVSGSKTKIAPIVSSARSAEIILRSWDKKFGRTADAIVVEGPLAGGHLGFSENDLKNENVSLETILKDVLTAIRPYMEKYKTNIPVIAAGGIYSGKQIAKLLSLGAEGVQLGSKFVTTEECDADEAFKMAYVNAKEEDLRIIKSPVGMPGRAINGPFLELVQSGKVKAPLCQTNCLRPCVPEKAPYCIANALINAGRGNLRAGFAFAGANAYRENRISTVKEVIDALMAEAEEFFI